jgi:transcriptional regulator of nitric oxide reductase
VRRLLRAPQYWLFGGGSILFLAILFVVPSVLDADDLTGAEQALLKEVMPDADTFTKRDGQPPVFKAYRSDPDTKARELVGYVFLTSDIPPEEVGYSAPIEVLVGMDLTGTLTGVKVGRYRESIIRIWGDFLRLPGVQEQFAGKRVTDPFRVGRDVAGITRATITMRAMSRGIREAARRVTQEYLNPYAASTPVPPATITDSVDRVSAPTDDNAPGQSQAVGLAQLHVDELAFSSGETESALSQALSDGTVNGGEIMSQWSGAEDRSWRLKSVPPLAFTQEQ